MKVPTWVLSRWDEPAAVFTGMISNSLDFPGFGIKDGPNAIWDDSGYNDSTPRGSSAHGSSLPSRKGISSELLYFRG